MCIGTTYCPFLVYKLTGYMYIIPYLQVENLSENEQFKGKKVHGFIGLQFGAWREAANR